MPHPTKGMVSVPEEALIIAGTLATVSVVAAIGLTATLIAYVRTARAELHGATRELLSLTKRLEGLTALRRERMVRHYDAMLATLSTRLPTSVASQVSPLVVEAEAKILRRLEELEPAMTDEGAKQKMSDLVKSMERLEHTIVSLTADTVQQVMHEGRRSLLEEEFGSEAQ